MKIIGICGLIGSGKDTAAQYLIDSRDFVRVSFADTLKDATSAVFSWDRNMIEGKTPEARAEREKIDPFWSEKLERDWSPRIALQYLGTELFRDNLHKDVWVIAAEKKILNHFDNHKNVVISDVRFPNEIAMIKNMDGQIWWIVRGDIPDWFTDAMKQTPQWMETFRPEHHPSEWAWAQTPFDEILYNNGTLADLYQKIEELEELM